MEVSPAQTPSCKPAGGKREVKTRMEEPGGGWRREDFSNLFGSSSQIGLLSITCRGDYSENTPVHLWAHFGGS